MFAAEAAVAAYQDLHLRPGGPEAGDDAGQLLQRAGGAVAVGRPQQGQQRVIATEDVQRQVAVGIVVAVEEAAQLVTVPHEVRRVQVQNDPRGWDGVLPQEGRDEEGLQGVEVGHDLLVAAWGVGPDGGELQAVEGALAGQRLAAVVGALAVLAVGVLLADEDGQEGVVVVEVLVAQAEAEEALLEEFGEGMLDLVGVAVVGEAAGELVDEVELGFDLAEEEVARVGGNGGAVEADADSTAAEGLKGEGRWHTLCSHGAVLGKARKRKVLNPLRIRGQPCSSRR